MRPFRIIRRAIASVIFNETAGGRHQSSNQGRQKRPV